MRQQLEFVIQRDGMEGAREYAKRALQAYRGAARYRNPEKPSQRLFVHHMPYRPHYVRSIIELRRFLAGGSEG